MSLAGEAAGRCWGRVLASTAEGLATSTAAPLCSCPAHIVALQGLLQDAGASSPLAELQLDFNGYLQRRRQEQQRRQSVARAGRPGGAM